MSLDWNLKECQKSDAFKAAYPDGEDDRLNPVTEALIWATLSVGIGKITHKNWEDFAARLELVQDIHGACLRKSNGSSIVDCRVTPQDVLGHVGLSTNVAKESWPTFAHKLRRDAQRRVALAKKKITEGF